MFNHFLASSSFFGLFLAGRALAGIYTTNPVADTVVQAGQTLTINWGKCRSFLPYRVMPDGSDLCMTQSMTVSTLCWPISGLAP